MTYCSIVMKIRNSALSVWSCCSCWICCYDTVWFVTAWHGMVWLSLVWHGMKWFGMVLIGHSMVMVQHGMVWHGYVSRPVMVRLCPARAFITLPPARACHLCHARAQRWFCYDQLPNIRLRYTCTYMLCFKDHHVNPCWIPQIRCIACFTIWVNKVPTVHWMFWQWLWLHSLQL